MTVNSFPNSVLLRRPQVQRRTGLSRSTIYELMSAGKFPTSIQLTDRSVGWLAHEIDDWIASRVAQSRNHAIPNLNQGVFP